MRILIVETTWAASAASYNLAEAGFLTTRCEGTGIMTDFLRHGRQDAIVIGADANAAVTCRTIARIRDLDSRIPLVVLSNCSSPETRIRLLQAGADTVMTVGSSTVELAARLRSLVLRNKGFAWPELKFGDVTIDAIHQKVTATFGKTVNLSRLEYEILETLFLNRGSTLSQDEIMAQLYAWQDEPDMKVVAVYLCNIRRKLGVAGSLIETVWGRGYQVSAVGAAQDDPEMERLAEQMPAAA